MSLFLYDKPELLRIATDSALDINFVVEIEGIISGGFTDVDGLEEEITQRTIKENHSNVAVNITSQIQFPDIVLMQGLKLGEKLFDWYKECRDWTKGKPDYRKNISIIQLKWVKGLPMEYDRWDFYLCSVKSYKAPTFKSNKDGSASIVSISITRENPMEKPYSLSNVSDVTNTLEILL